MNVCVIIAAAGASERFGSSDKLAQDLGGRAVLLRTVELFAQRSEVGSILVAGPPDSLVEFKDRYGPTLAFHGATIVEGGRSERSESVRNALSAVPDSTTHVGVHDAARPGVSKPLLDRIFEAAANVPAVVPGLTVDATVKRVSGEAVQVAEEEDAIADAILGSSGRKTVDVRYVTEPRTTRCWSSGSASRWRSSRARRGTSRSPRRTTCV
jgi:2-C-methyl-D-erythritol 4-phosphate cytidylyltransferase